MLQKILWDLKETSYCALISFHIIVFIFQQIDLKYIIILKWVLMGFSTFMQLIVHLLHSFDGSQRLPFLHLHETTVKDKLNGCLFHLQIFSWKLYTNSPLLVYNKIIPLKDADPCQEDSSTNEKHKSSSTPLPWKKNKKTEILLLFASCQHIKSNMSGIARWTPICCNLLSSQVSKDCRRREECRCSREGCALPISCRDAVLQSLG